MKKFNKIMLLLVCVLLCCVIAACTENTKQDAIELTGDTTVSSNGGTAVQYGNYIYFVNGYAGSAVLNTFGSVKTGAICRVTLSEKDGKIVVDPESFCVVVPKNVYGTDTTYPGIYIAGGYLYYHTTSVDKNSKREYKTDEGVIMRTRLDGSKSEIVQSFSDNATVFYASQNYLVYAVKDESSVTSLHAIKLADLKDSVIEENVSSYKFTENYAVYTVSKDSSDNVIKAFSFASGVTGDVLSTDIYKAYYAVENDKYAVKTTVTDVKDKNGKLYLLYTKEDNSSDGIEKGYYFAALPGNSQAIPTLDKNIADAKEYRLSNEIADSNGNGTTYSALYVMDDGSFMTYNSKTFYLFDKDGKRRVNEEDADKKGAYVTYAITDADVIVGVYETENEVYAYYTKTDAKIDETSYTAIKYIKIFDKKDGVYDVAIENTKAFFYFNYKSTYTTYELTDLYYYGANGRKDAKAVFYLNSDLGTEAFACYYILQDGADRENATEAAGKLLGKIEAEKLVDFISSGKVEEDD